MEYTEIITIITYFVTGASVILKGAEIIAKYTDTKTDDKIVSTIITYLKKAESILHFVAINPKRK